MGEDRLSPYRAKRDFSRTKEPAGGEPSAPGGPTGVFVVQQHAARRMHWDFRLEVDGVLASWAVPRGPSLDPAHRRLAVPTEDHPMDYRHFEGTIPAGEYGGGAVIVWDEGHYLNGTRHDGATVPVRPALDSGHVTFALLGHKLRGVWSLTRLERSRDGKPAWLLVKSSDADARPGYDVVADRPESVVSGNTIEDLSGGAPAARRRRR